MILNAAPNGEVSIATLEGTVVFQGFSLVTTFPDSDDLAYILKDFPSVGFPLFRSRVTLPNAGLIGKRILDC